MKKKGISLIVLVITIIVIAILAGTIIFTILNNNTLDQSKKAKFMSDYRTVQEGVNLYSLSKFNKETKEFELPLKGYLTSEDKTYIAENVPTLKTKIEELSGAVDTVNLAWINSEDIGVKLSSEKAEKGYILDVANGLIYDYNGDYFEGQMWHTLDGGVISNGPGVPGGSQIDEELWNGWIKLTLYYPSNSTQRQWRLGTEGELRADPMLMWQNYTGPISIPLDRIKDVWIKYKIDDKEVVIPPVGTLLVDIVPDKTGYTKVPGVKVHINFDESATVKEYRIGDSAWIPYTGEFSVTENCIIEARAKKTETIYNTDGTVLTTRNIAGRDLVYIGNIGIVETDLAAPTITRLPPVGAEKARVQVTYPANADKKIYKVNYGIEENYTTEISVQNYGTYIIAYYYDASGKRSKAAGIRINDITSGEPAEVPGPYNPLPPYEPGNPPPYTPGSPLPPYDPGKYGINIPAPTVVVSPTSIAEEVQVSVNAPLDADKIYIKLGRYGDYQLYTSPLIIRENMNVYAYYRTYAGERSNTGYGRVNNIKKTNRPYVSIDADPYPYSSSYGAEEVNVTINYSDATTIEYSEDGVLFVPYTAPFKVTKNETVYARGINSYGVTETSLNITNIGKIKPPTPLGKLSVGINVNPEPTLSVARYAKATVSIDYDTEATEKYYRIGTYGELKPYTGEFEVTSNCTIYAIAKGTNATGSTLKRIDNLSSGIAEPVISTVPGSNEQTSKVAVTIDYDKYSKIKRYSIDGGALRDYSTPLEVTKNGTVIYAYSENDVGQKSETRYAINNIVPEPPVLLLDKGQYYILKLNYPPNSKNQEYKWKANGVWTGYKEAGILLVKPQYKDQLIQNGTLVKIEDENGNLVTFTGDYYLIDMPIAEISENLFMRWDREPLGAPQIVITPSEPSMQVSANIVYNSNLIKKQYKVLNPDGSVKTDWTNYTGEITIDRNNSVVYAKGMDDSEVWTAESMKKITNIDENSPVITITADLSTAQQKVAVKVSVTDDVGVGKVKWAPGTQGESYFTASGSEIQNNSIVNITSNGYYTFYAEDQVGNTQIYTLNVTNVDLAAPKIDIQVSPETTVGLNANVTINFGDSVTKQYKVGTSNITWTNYTTSFAISSNTVLTNNWQNADGTVTIYAKGKDSAGNEITVQKKIVSLDLDRPQAPVITSNSGYPVLTSYGVKFDSQTTITYDTRTDIDNYYSIDNGTTWLKYTGTFNFQSGTIIAKSVKKNTGLDISTSKTVTMPSDAFVPASYDGSDSTSARYYSGRRILVDSEVWGKSVRIYAYANTPNTNKHSEYIYFKDVSGNILYQITIGDRYSFSGIVTIPNNTKNIMIGTYGAGYVDLYEVQLANEPTFTATNGYITLYADSTKNVTQPYQMVSINYYPTTVERLYSLDGGTTWLNYQDTPIKVNHGSVIHAKGIDQSGVQTRTITSYTSNSNNAIYAQAVDKNYSTYTRQYNATYLKVDSSLKGKNVQIKAYANTPNTNKHTEYIRFLDENMNILSTIAMGDNSWYNGIYTMPSQVAWIVVNTEVAGFVDIYEIEIANEPTFSSVNGYMLLHTNPLEAIKEPYQMVTINYFPNSVQRLYSLDGGTTWLNYQDAPVKVIHGRAISAKGIDKYGVQTRVVSSYTSNSTNAIKAAAYDGNYATYTREYNGTLMRVDPIMSGKVVRIRAYANTSNVNKHTEYINFLDENKNILSTISIPDGATYDASYTIPNQAAWISTSTYGSNAYVDYYDIQLVP